jgi:fibronectin-binding autotransporter adhesin
MHTPTARNSSHQSELRPLLAIQANWRRVCVWAGTVLALWCLAPAALGGQGTASYIDFDDVNPGFGTPFDTTETALNWSTSSAGTATATARPSGTQLTIGNVDSDFAGPTPFAFTINLNGGGNLQGVLIKSTNVNVTFTGTANTHNNSGPNTWTITNNSTLTVNDTRQAFVVNGTVKGLNWNNVAVTFQGSGTINFPTPIGCNSTALNTQNMPGGVINLQMAPVSGASSYSGGYTLTAGTLNFASEGSSNAFNGFIAGKNFSINGGTIDNTSGLPLILSVGLAGYSLGGDFTFTGTSRLDFGPAPVALATNVTVTVSASALSLGPISGSGFGLTKAGAGTLTLSGANTYSGNTMVINGSTLALTSSSSLPNSPLVVSASKLDLSGLTAGTMSTPSFSVTNSTLTLGVVSTAATNIVAGTLNVGGTTTLNIASLPLATTPYPITYHLINATTVNGNLNFALGTLPPSSPAFSAFITNRTASGSVDLVLTSGPAPVHFLTWSGLNGGSPDGTWDIGTTPTWLNNGTPSVFQNSDFVTFNDTSTGQSSINLTTTLLPTSVTVSNNTKLFTLGGGGKISGSVSLNKSGAGTLILDETGGNDFTGGVTINAGTLQVGNNDFAGSLPPAGNVVDNGALVFTRLDGSIVLNVISGSGSVAQNSSGTLNLGAANTFSGPVTVNQGTLQLGNSSALGTTNGITTIANGATLDFGANANNIGQEPVVVSGSGVGGLGALVNSSGSGTFVGPNVARVTLAGDTTFGGSGRWDLRSATTSDPNLGSLSTGGIARKLTKVGGNQVGLVGITVDPTLGDIEVQSGILSIEAATTGLGNSASNLIVFPGATFQMFAITNQLNKVITLGSDGVSTTISATSGSNNIVGPMTLTNDCIFNVASGVALTLNNVLSGPGMINKIGTGLLTLSGNAPSYTGGLQLNSGTITLSGTLGNNLGVTISPSANSKFILNGSLLGAGITNAAPSTVTGSGSSAGFADIAGNLLPGDADVVGTLIFGGLTLEAGAALTYDFGAVNTPGSGVNDLIVVNGDLVINGNTVTINAMGLLQNGVPYRLFNYTGKLIWNSDLIIQNQGSATYVFAVRTNIPGNVSIVVVGGGPPVWNGGSATDSNWSDAANWHGIAISPGSQLYFGGTSRLNNFNDTPADTSYGDIAFTADAGAFVLNGHPVMPAGNIINLKKAPTMVVQR